MKAGEIEVGGRYVAKVSNRLVTVRVMSIDERHDVIRGQNVTRYLVQNELTGRTLTFRSAAKFRRVSV